jgi:hypothetical protein
VQVRSTSTGATVKGALVKTGASTYRFTPSRPWTAGESYRLSVSSAVKTASTTAPVVVSTSVIRASTTVDSSSPALTKRSGDYSWSTKRASDALGKTYLLSDDKKKTSKRSYVEASVRGSSVQVYACKGRSSGKMRIYVNG